VFSRIAIVNRSEAAMRLIAARGARLDALGRGAEARAARAAAATAAREQGARTPNLTSPPR
jgi:hypothetical protein